MWEVGPDHLVVQADEAQLYIGAIVTVALVSRSGRVQRLPADIRGRLVAARKG